MKKQSKTFITTSRTAAIKLAKQGLKLNDKTLRLKNVSVYDTQFICKNKCGGKPAIQVIADTNMQDRAVMVVGICKKHTNVSRVITNKK
jgi:type IV secretory pathway VirB4 component